MMRKCNEPTIIKRGNDRILIELPGLDDPNRIKKLLGKTANLTFRLVSETENDFGSELLYFEDNEQQLNISKRILLSGDNLITAKPSFDNKNNETIVSFTLDRVGAKKFASATSNLVLTLAKNSSTAVAMFPVASTTETSAEPPCADAVKIFALTLITASPLVLTVCIAFPEYIGEVKLPPSIATTSCTTGMFLRAARRAAKSLD